MADLRLPLDLDEVYRAVLFLTLAFNVFGQIFVPVFLGFPVKIIRVNVPDHAVNDTYSAGSNIFVNNTDFDCNVCVMTGLDLCIDVNTVS